MKKYAIFYSDSLTVEVYDVETEKSEYFCSVAAMLNKYKNLHCVTIKTSGHGNQ